jgi:four helix bundle protein
MEEEIETFELNEEGKPYNIKHRSYYLAKDVVKFVGACRYERIYHSMFDQLIRSATSIGANLVEGVAGSTKKDWRNYYAIALKSANETKYWLCLIRDTVEVSKDEMNHLIVEVNEISKIIASIIVKSR